MTNRPLSHTKRGKLLAAIGGLAGGPLGVIVSPLVLKLINAKQKEGNRFVIWFFIGIFASPLCWLTTIFAYIAISSGRCQVNPISSTNCDFKFPTPN